MNVLEVGDVVTVVIHGRGEEGGQGHGPHPKVLEIVQLGLNACNNIQIVSRGLVQRILYVYKICKSPKRTRPGLFMFRSLINKISARWQNCFTDVMHICSQQQQMVVYSAGVVRRRSARMQPEEKLF